MKYPGNPGNQVSPTADGRFQVIFSCFVVSGFAGHESLMLHPREPSEGSSLQGETMKSKSGHGAYLLIILGVFFLLLNFGWLPRLGPLVSKWWPLILIIMGVFLLSRRSS
jgi:hypothetical protein